MIIVSKGKEGDYTTIQDAIDNAKSGDTILIKEGIYNERITVKTPGLTIIGSNSDWKTSLYKKGNTLMEENISPHLPSDKTIISFGLYAMMPKEDIGKLGTFRTYTMLIDAPDVTLKNLTIENSSGTGKHIGQAIALYAEGDKLQFENVRLLGWQDTLFTGPLPEKEIEKNGFKGPKEFSPRINGRQYYKNCYIEGDIDFIFGSATAYFESCTIFQKDREKYLINKEKRNPDSPKSYATAASTPEGQKYGYIFDNCRFESDCPPGSCYLGRPWRNFAHVLIRNSYLGPAINPLGFHNWNKKEAEETVRFQEYDNYGPGASDSENNIKDMADTSGSTQRTRASFVKALSSSEISEFDKYDVVPFI